MCDVASVECYAKHGSGITCGIGCEVTPGQMWWNGAVMEDVDHVPNAVQLMCKMWCDAARCGGAGMMWPIYGVI